MDAIMGNVSGIHSSLLNGLDIVAMISADSGTRQYPDGALYGLIVGSKDGILVNPVLFKARKPGVLTIGILWANADGQQIRQIMLEVTGSDYTLSGYNASIIWFG